MSSNYCTIILKPDTHKDILTEMIIKDLKENGLLTIFSKDKILSLDEAKNIYLEHLGHPHYEASVKSLMGDNKNQFITILILKSKDGNALENANKIKGLSDVGGIRFKYRRFSKKDLEDMGYDGEKLTIKLAENRLHVPGSDSRSLKLVEMLLSNSEKEDIRDNEPELYKEFEKWRQEKKEDSLVPEYKKPFNEIRIK